MRQENHECMNQPCKHNKRQKGYQPCNQKAYICMKTEISFKSPLSMLNPIFNISKRERRNGVVIKWQGPEIK